MQFLARPKLQPLSLRLLQRLILILLRWLRCLRHRPLLLWNIKLRRKEGKQLLKHAQRTSQDQPPYLKWGEVGRWIAYAWAIHTWTLGSVHQTTGRWWITWLQRLTSQNKHFLDSHKPSVRPLKPQNEPRVHLRCRKHHIRLSQDPREDRISRPEPKRELNNSRDPFRPTIARLSLADCLLQVDSDHRGNWDAVGRLITNIILADDCYFYKLRRILEGGCRATTSDPWISTYRLAMRPLIGPPARLAS